MQTRTLIILIVVIQALFAKYSLAQETNTQPTEEKEVVVDSIPKHSPKLATWMSVAIPGAGQIYNKSYWKVPVIYIIGAGLTYTTIANNRGYYKYKEAYYHLYENPDDPMEGFEVYTLDQLKTIKDEFRSYRDLSIVGLVILYTLNIVDATVDGYLFDYDVSDDLSLRVEPQILNSYYTNNSFSANQQYGFKLTFKF